MGNRTILISAGGTGGHLFPAQSLAGELQSRGWVVDLATDERADRYGGNFPARNVHIIASATLTGRSPVAAARTLLQLARGTWQSFWIMGRIKPQAIVGFGGYPTFPPLAAARLRAIPTLLHEQNGVMGRANRLLAKWVTAIATSTPSVALTQGLEHKMVTTGNPVRPQVIEASQQPYDAPQPDGPFRFLVFGGSQGARFLSDLVPEAIGLLDPAYRARLQIVQQCRPEDLDRVAEVYDRLGVAAELAAFFPDLARRMADAHLVLSRSGASTVSELAVIGRPALLVPLPHALDQDQAYNAHLLVDAGGAWLRNQADLDGQALAADLKEMMDQPLRLVAAARAAGTIGRPDAVARLADLVETIGTGEPVAARVSGEV